MDDFRPKPRLRSLLDHFSEIEDPREAWRVAHPLAEVLLLIACATIASYDYFDDIAAWGENHLPFLRRFLPCHHGIPGARWLNIPMNRMDPGLFSGCFMSWASELRPDAPSLIALDGKTSRRSHDRAAGKAALHLVSAFATHEKLVLGQEAVDTKANEITAIPAPLERLAASGTLTGALVSIDAYRELHQRSPAAPVRMVSAKHSATSRTLSTLARSSWITSQNERVNMTLSFSTGCKQAYLQATKSGRIQMPPPSRVHCSCTMRFELVSRGCSLGTTLGT